MSNVESEAWDQGYEVGFSGESTQKNNPYENGTSEYVAWAAGFKSGRQDLETEMEDD